MKQVPCPYCGGDGLHPNSNDEWESCPDCLGNGYVLVEDSDEVQNQPH